MKLLETTAQSHELEKIITDSDSFLIILSPYLQISKRLKPKLEECFIRNKRSLILYRENKLTSYEMDWFDKFPNVHRLPIQHLHAKCYVNERSALITSMNWYEHSQINNHELGVLLDSAESEKEFKTLLAFINNILRTDHPSRNIKEYTEYKSEFTLGRLYAELTASYQFPPMKDGLNAVYQKISDQAEEHVKFKPECYKKGSNTLLRNTVVSSTVFETVKKFMIDNWVAKPGELVEEYDWVKFNQEWFTFLTKTYPAIKFRFVEGVVFAEDFPAKNIDFSTRYGFASFVLNYNYDFTDWIKEQKWETLHSRFQNYRLYWSPSNKINIYHAKNIYFKNVNDDIKYCKEALMNIIEELQKIATSALTSNGNGRMR